MDAKNKHSKNKKLPLLLVAGVLVLVGVITGFVFQENIRAIATDITASVQDRDKPKFALDTAEFSDWVTSGNTYHDGEQDGSQTTAMLVSQCEPDSHCSDLMDDSLMADKCETTSKQQCEKLQQATDAGACMVHFYHYNHPISPNEAISDFLKPTPGFEVDIREVDVETLNMSTPEGDKAYQLHQYNSDNKSGDYKSGVSLGYIPLKDSHIEIRGICDTSDQLDEVLPILNAVRLEV